MLARTQETNRSGPTRTSAKSMQESLQAQAAAMPDTRTAAASSNPSHARPLLFKHRNMLHRSDAQRHSRGRTGAIRAAAPEPPMLLF